MLPHLSKNQIAAERPTISDRYTADRVSAVLYMEWQKTCYVIPDILL